MACAVPATGNAFLSGVLAHIDCEAQTIGASGYQALADPASSVSLVLTALLTIFVALFGIRMLLGHVPSISELVVAALKIGVVLMLATSWAGYRVIAYDAVLRGPAELVGAIGAPSDLPGAEGGLAARLQGVDEALIAFIVAGSGRFETPVEPRAGATAALPAGRVPVNDDFAFGLARTIYLAGTIGALGLVRLVAGLLLALAPLFAGLLLFEATRSFFMGWLRMLIASALGALAVSVILGVQLGVIEPWLSNVLALRAARYATPAAPAELLVIMLAFAVILIGVITAAARIAFNPATIALIVTPVRRLGEALTQPLGLPAVDLTRPSVGTDAAPRAFLVAEAMAATQRREAERTAEPSGPRAFGGAGPTMTAMRRDETGAAFVPIGRSYGRNSRRIAALATRRSQRA